MVLVGGAMRQCWLIVNCMVGKKWMEGKMCVFCINQCIGRF